MKLFNGHLKIIAFVKTISLSHLNKNLLKLFPSEIDLYGKCYCPNIDPNFRMKFFNGCRTHELSLLNTFSSQIYSKAKDICLIGYQLQYKQRGQNNSSVHLFHHLFIYVWSRDCRKYKILG